jgi:hypothetical protein
MNLKANKFKNGLNATIDNLIQDIYMASEETHQALQVCGEEYLGNFNQKLQLAMEAHLHYKGQPVQTITPPHTSSWFPNVHLEPMPRWSPNLFDSSASLPDYNKARHVTPFSSAKNGSTKDFWTANAHHASQTAQMVPTMVQVNMNGTYYIQPLNHDQTIKRAKIQFTGLGDIFVFYNQLMNSMDQFGIDLIPLNNVSYQTDLCPKHYQGTLISHYHHTQMASTLYQKLQDTDVIPMEYMAIRNIINWYAEENDGYKVLYSMLELVHPALQHDVIKCLYMCIGILFT